jgi:hypothetical protein
VAHKVCRLSLKVWDEDVEPKRWLLAGEELPHGFLGWLGEVVPVSSREAGLAE